MSLATWEAKKKGDRKTKERKRERENARRLAEGKSLRWTEDAPDDPFDSFLASIIRNLAAWSHDPSFLLAADDLPVGELLALADLAFATPPAAAL
jgi:hypothetical protein